MTVSKPVIEDKNKLRYLELADLKVSAEVRFVYSLILTLTIGLIWKSKPSRVTGKPKSTPVTKGCTWVSVVFVLSRMMVTNSSYVNHELSQLEFQSLCSRPTAANKEKLRKLDYDRIFVSVTVQTLFFFTNLKMFTNFGSC